MVPNLNWKQGAEEFCPEDGEMQFAQTPFPSDNWPAICKGAEALKPSCTIADNKWGKGLQTLNWTATKSGYLYQRTCSGFHCNTCPDRPVTREWQAWWAVTVHFAWKLLSSQRKSHKFLMQDTSPTTKTLLEGMATAHSLTTFDLAAADSK